MEWDTGHKAGQAGNKLMVDNPFLVRTPSTAVVDMQGTSLVSTARSIQLTELQPTP